MGLGEEFARQLAPRKVNLLLVARSKPQLEALAAELASQHKIQAFSFACDLAQPQAARQVVEFMEQNQLRPTWLINNAGYGDAGEFASISPERLLGSIMVNVAALTELTRLLLPQMKDLPEARIINVASTAAFQPVPYLAVYSATKAFVLSFTEALSEELRSTSVKVLCLCPGPTATSFAENARMEFSGLRGVQQPGQVVSQALKASDRSQALLITQGKLMVASQRLAPRSFVRRIAGMLGKSYLKGKG